MSNLRDKAIELINQYIKNENLKKHLLATEALMKALANKFGENQEIWGLAGLLHDLDWEITKHNHLQGLIPETLLEKSLYSCEEITGLIVAVALVMPNKKLAEVTVEKIMSKFKEPSFARGVNREIIKKCEEMLNISVEELAEICLKAMQEISDQLGL